MEEDDGVGVGGCGGDDVWSGDHIEGGRVEGGHVEGGLAMWLPEWLV